MSTYKPTVIIAGRENQLDDPDGLDVAHLANVDYVQFDTSYAGSSVEGRLQWNSVDGTLEVGMPGGNVTLQIGQEQLVLCRNTTGSTINNGSAVYISGEAGNRPLISLARADAFSTARVFGVTTENIANTANGYITTSGQVRSMNTYGLVEGDRVFLSANTAGGLETSPAVAPSYKARVGWCLKTHNSEGVVLVDPTVTPNLTSLSDCYGTPADDGDHMTWVTANSRFEITPEGPVKTGWNTDAVDEAVITYNSANLTLSVTPTGNSFDFWVEGAKYTKTTPQNVTISNTEGLWFVYFDSSGDLQASQTPWSNSDTDKAFVSSPYWDAAGGEFVTVGMEFHSWVMDTATHGRIHDAEGSSYITGLALGNMTVDGSGSSNASAQFSVGDGSFFDEDIRHSIANGAPQTLSTIAELPILYRIDATGLWRKFAATQYPVHPTGSGKAAWNEWTGATWQITEVGSNDYTLSHVFATNDVTEPMVVVMGQNEYGTVGQARTGAETEVNSLLLGDLEDAFQEFIPVATIIWQTQGSYSNAVKSRVRSTDEGDDYIDWRGRATARGAVSGVTNHSALSGLLNDDHTQYSLVDGTRDFTGNVTVNGIVNAYAYDTGNYRIDETSSRLQFINELETGDTHFDFLPAKSGGDGEDDVFLYVWATGGISNEYLKIGYESDLSPQRYVIETFAVGGGTHHPIHFVYDSSTVMFIDSDGLTVNNNVTVNSGNIAVTGGDVTVNSGNVAVTGGIITIDDVEVIKVLDVNKTIYLRTTGDDSNGGYASDDAFLTSERAIAELHTWKTGNYLLIVDVGEGTFNHTAAINPAHSDGQSIFWSGVIAAYTSRTINNIDGSATALSIGLEYIDFDVSLPAASGAAVGHYILVKTTSGGTNPNLVKGCHEIVTWNGTTNVATVRCVRADGVTTLPSGTITANTLTLVKSTFNFSVSNGIVSSGVHHCGTWDKMVIKGSLSNRGIWLFRRGTIVLGVNLGTSKWDINMLCQYNSDIYASSSTHSYSDSNIIAMSNGGFVLLSSAILSGCGTVALRCWDGSAINFHFGQIYCGGTVLYVHSYRGAFINAVNSIVEGCYPTGSTAFYVASGGGIDSSDATDDAVTSRDQEGAPGGNGSYHAY